MQVLWQAARSTGTLLATLTSRGHQWRRACRAIGLVSPAADTSLNSRCSNTGRSSSRPGAEGQQGCPLSRRTSEGWPPRSSNSRSIQRVLHSRQPLQPRNPTRATVAQRSGAICALVGVAVASFSMSASSQLTGWQCILLQPACARRSRSSPVSHGERSAAPLLTSCLFCSCQR